MTSKLSCKEIDGQEVSVPLSEVHASIQGSLDRLGSAPNLYLVHNPYVAEPGKLKQLWSILEDFKDAGKLKSIGVSNFRPQDLNTILKGARHKPVCNQLEFRPYTLAHLAPLLALQAQHGILTTSYGPLTPVLRHPTGGPLKPILSRIAQRLSHKYGPDCGIDSTTVLLLWTKARGAAAITASGNPSRIQGLAKTYLSDWELHDDEVEEIDRVGQTIHYRYYTEHMEKEFPLPDLPSQ